MREDERGLGFGLTNYVYYVLIGGGTVGWHDIIIEYIKIFSIHYTAREGG